MRARRRAALVALALLAAAPARGLEELAAPDAHPPSAFAGYWLALAWTEHKPQGPEKARGLVFWNHGVSGDLPQYHHAPPDAIRRLARAGWDVVKVQRNPTHEASGHWNRAGFRHVDDLVKRAEAAKAEGYRRVVAAGQSYGGAIAAEASARSAAIDVVLAFAPGHGSDARNAGSHGRISDNLTAMLAEAIRGMKAGRAAVLVAMGDDLQRGADQGPEVRAALERFGRPFVLFDSRMPIRGHGAAGTRQFDAWYGECLLRFVEAAAPPAGETVCPAPADPRFILADGLRPAAPPADLPRERAALAGVWRGVPDPNGQQEWLVVVTELRADSARWWLATDSGPRQSMSMGSGWWAAKREGDVYVARNAAGFRHEMRTTSDGETVEYALFDPQGRERWRTRLRRGALD